MMTLCFILHLIVGYNMFENKKGEFRIRNSKTDNTVAKKIVQRTNNGEQNTTKKFKIWATNNLPHKYGVNTDTTIR